MKPSVYLIGAFFVMTLTGFSLRDRLYRTCDENLRQAIKREFESVKPYGQLAGVTVCLLSATLFAILPVLSFATEHHEVARYGWLLLLAAVLSYGTLLRIIEFR